MKHISNEKLESSSVQDLKNRVSKSRSLRNQIAGYSKLDKARLITAISQVQNDKKPFNQRKKGESYWREGLKEYNKGKDTFSIPKVGTKAHSEVKKLAERLKGENNTPISESVKLKKPSSKKKESPVKVDMNPQHKESPEKKRRGRPKKVE